MQPKTIVEQFIADIHAQRFDEAKTLLVAEGFEYVGPNMRFLSPDDIMSYQFGMAAIQKNLILRQLSADGEHVFAILDIRPTLNRLGMCGLPSGFVCGTTRSTRWKPSIMRQWLKTCWEATSLQPAESTGVSPAV